MESTGSKGVSFEFRTRGPGSGVSSIPGKPTPGASSVSRNPGTNVTCLKMEEKCRQNSPMGSETHRNELSSGFRSQ
jgi:hypothetical protein